MQVDISKHPAVKIELTMTLDELSELHTMMNQITCTVGWKDASKVLAADIMSVIETFYKNEGN